MQPCNLGRYWGEADEGPNGPASPGLVLARVEI